MNIWIFNHDACTPKTGPLLRHYFFGKELIKRGHDVSVFASNEIHFNKESININKGKYTIKDDEGVPFIFVRTTKYFGNGISRVRNMLSFYFNLLFIYKEIFKKYGKPDVIIGSSVHPLSCVAAIQIGRKLNVPAIVEIRDLWPEAIFAFGKAKERSLLGKILIAGEKWIYKNGDAIIFTKEGDVDYIIERKWDKDQGGSINLDKCYYINNGLDLEKFNNDILRKIPVDIDLSEDYFNVTYVGSIRPVNNIENIIDAAKLLMNYKEIKFQIFGDGIQYNKLLDRIKAENLSNVNMHGYINKDYIPNILSKSSVNILNYSQTKYNWSRGNSSNKLFEYMASGKPIISTVKMGYSIINKYNCGIELEDNTPENLAEAILKIKKMNKSEYNMFGQSGKNGAKDFDFEILTNKLVKVVNFVTKEKN